MLVHLVPKRNRLWGRWASGGRRGRTAGPAGGGEGGPQAQLGKWQSQERSSGTRGPCPEPGGHGGLGLGLDSWEGTSVTRAWPLWGTAGEEVGGAQPRAVPPTLYQSSAAGTSPAFKAGFSLWWALPTSSPGTPPQTPAFPGSSPTEGGASRLDSPLLAVALPRACPPAPPLPTSLPPRVPVAEGSAFPEPFPELTLQGLASLSPSEDPFQSLCSTGLTPQARVVHTLHSPEKGSAFAWLLGGNL